MRIDLWQTEREAAKVLPSGVRVQLKDEPPVARIWRPKGLKPDAHYRFRTIEDRDRYVSEYVANYSKAQEAKRERATARKGTPEAIASVKPGTIFYSSWGYDQTNIDYYEVIERSGRYVTIRELAHKSLSGPGHEDRVWPDPGNYISKPTRKLLQFGARGEEPYLTIASYASAWLWDGRPRHQTASGWGH